MKATTQKLTVGLILLSLLFSCKAYRNVENLQPKVSKVEKNSPFVKESLTKLVEGDKILVVTTDEKSITLNYLKHNENEIEGILKKVNDKKIEGEEIKQIQILEIKKLYVLRTSAGATIPFILALGLGITIAVAAIAWSRNPIVSI